MAPVSNIKNFLAMHDNITSPLPLVLASSSVTRSKLLEKLRIPFEIVAPAVAESMHAGESPSQMAERLSIAKASAVAEKKINHLIIGCDQVAVVAGEMVGKPKNREDAIRFLKAASGNEVVLYSGLALKNSQTEQIQSDVVEYRVEFRKLTDTMIETYIDVDQPYDCAGALRSEGIGITLLKKFDGDDPNALLGLPLIRLVEMLKIEGIDPLDR